MRYLRNKPHALVPPNAIATMKIRVIRLSARKPRRSLSFAAAGNVKVLLVRIGVGGSQKINHILLRVVGLQL